MTNASTFQMWHWRRLAAPVAAICLMALPLAGCSTFGSGATATADGGDNLSSPVASAPGRAKLAFAPIVGAPAAVADMLSGSVASAMEKQSVPVSHGAADTPDYTVRGYLVAAPDKAGTKLSYIWDVTDKTGQRAKRITGEEILKGKKVKDPWSQVDQSVVDRIAAATTSQLAPWVPMKGGASLTPPGKATEKTASATESTSSSFGSSFGSAFGKLFGTSGGDQTASASPAAPTAPPQPASLGAPKPGSLVTGTVTPPPAAVAAAPAATASLTPAGRATTAVPIVTGAPGDGATALTAAIQRSLTSNGVQLAAAGGGGSYTVQGRVTMGTPSAGKQSIKIEWQVFDPAGKKVGTVSQNNSVPQGSLDGTWGKTADAAAAAAAQGILKLLPHQTATN